MMPSPIEPLDTAVRVTLGDMLKPLSPTMAARLESWLPIMTARDAVVVERHLTRLTAALRISLSLTRAQHARGLSDGAKVPAIDEALLALKAVTALAKEAATSKGRIQPN